MALLPGCERGCNARPPESVVPVPDVPAAVVLRALPDRCVREITRAAVALPDGTGDVDALAPACAGDTLAVFVLRGHVLSRVTRSLRPGAGFGAALRVSTGADRMGPVGDGAVDGPVAWRSPVAGLDDPERDDLWAAVVAREDGGLPRVLRGDVLMPAGTVGLGLPVATARVGEAVEILAGIARAGENPATARLRITLGRDGAELPAGGAPAVVEGDLKAWEPSRGIALSRTVTPGGEVRLTAARPGGATAWLPVRWPQVLVAPRGVAAGGAAVFLTGGFAVGGDAGRCLDVGGLCVTPGPVDLLVAEGGTLRRVAVAPAGLPDAVSARGTEVTALYVDGSARQAAARIDLRSGAVSALALTPPEALPSIDHPTLVTCEDGPWMVAEVSLPRGDGGTTAAVTALPLECLVR